MTTAMKPAGAMARREVIQTRRFRLREISPDDIDFLAEMLADPEVMRYYPKPCTREEANAWLDRQLWRYAEHGHGLWLVERRETGEPVGQVGLIRQTVDGQPRDEIGYLVHRPYWRQGYATEAASGVRDYAFGELGLSRVVSLIRPENMPSQGVARKLGMQPVGEMLHHDLPHMIFALESRGPG